MGCDGQLAGTKIGRIRIYGGMCGDFSEGECLVGKKIFRGLFAWECSGKCLGASCPGEFLGESFGVSCPAECLGGMFGGKLSGWISRGMFGSKLSSWMSGEYLGECLGVNCLAECPGERFGKLAGECAGGEIFGGKLSWWMSGENVCLGVSCSVDVRVIPQCEKRPGRMSGSLCKITSLYIQLLWFASSWLTHRQTDWQHSTHYTTHNLNQLDWKQKQNTSVRCRRIWTRTHNIQLFKVFLSIRVTE